MEAPAPTRTGCLKRGCLGCSAAALALLLFFAVLALAGRLLTPDPIRERAELGPDRTGVPNAGTPVPGGAAETAAPAPPLVRGTLALQVEDAVVELRPAPAGTPLRIEAAYDSAAFELLEVEESTEEGGWTYRIVFRSRLGLLGFFREAEGDNRLTVHVPAGLPLDLEAELSEGEARFDLGTLDLERVALDLSRGDYLVDVSSPTASPLERLELHGRMAGLMLTGLGHASPRSIEVESFMAGLEVDLSGDWRTASDVRVRFRLGGCVVTAPLSTPLVVERAHVDAGDADLRVPERGPETPSPARPVRLDATGSMGGLVVRQR